MGKIITDLIDRDLLVDLIEFSGALLVTILCAALIWSGKDSEIKTLFVAGCTLVMKAGFDLKRKAEKTEAKNG
jgi:hypothetical protein